MQELAPFHSKKKWSSPGIAIAVELLLSAEVRSFFHRFGSDRSSGAIDDTLAGELANQIRNQR
jgi:hypothetical protein